MKLKTEKINVKMKKILP